MRHIKNGLFAFAIFATNAFGQTVGVTDFVVDGYGDSPGFTARLWFPTNHGIESRFGESRIRPGYLAVPNATPELPAQAPLIVLIHGSGGSAESMGWIGVGLARRGALVVAADHPASSGGNPERQSILHVWTQPLDVRRLLDQLLESAWGGLVNEKRIGVVGFSLGGAGALSLAGGQYQFERFPEFCRANDDGACDAFRHHFVDLDSAFYVRANADYSDSRVRAAIAIAPGFSESLTAGSLQQMTTPLLLISGESDQQLPPQTHVYPIREYLPDTSRYLEISGAQHFSFLPHCREDAIDVLAETNEEFVCQEVGLRTRAEIHAETLQEIKAFLVLNGILQDI